MRQILPFLLLLGACGRGDQPADNLVAPEPAGAARSGPTATIANDRLLGLYEGGSGPQKNQLCILEKGGEARFGLLVWGGNLHSCSGAGQAVRSGAQLTLTMTGDETCTIEARLANGIVTLPHTLPAGCAYYCGARATLAGAAFTRVGANEADARKATDIAGDPLCD